MKRLLVVAATGVLAGSALCSPTTAPHGGTYRGPGGTIPPASGGPGGTPSPSTADPTGDVASWAQWWSFNRDGYFNLRSAVQRGETVTGGLDFDLGRGQRERADTHLRPTLLDLQQRVVPALIAALGSETSVDIQGAALIALAKIGVEPEPVEGANGSAVVDAIRPFLADANQELAESAALALGILADERSVFVLADLLSDTAAGRRARGANQVDLRTRAFAAFGLGLVGSRTQKEDVRRFYVSRLSAALVLDETASRDLAVACAICLGLVPLVIAPRGASGAMPRGTTA
jgi:HEAT repeat protein